MLKPLFTLPQKTNLKFVKFFKLCMAASVLALVVTGISLATKGLNFGIDFRGGTLLEIQTKGPADLAKLRSAIAGLGLGEVQVQALGEANQVLIRFSEQQVPATTPPSDLEKAKAEAQKAAIDKVKSALGPDVEIRRNETVGSTVSGELVTSAIWALILTNVVIFIYVWFRFEWQFALGAIIALFHDVLFTIGIFSLLGLDFDLTIVAALLTILGYSINDTVVIYDRIRENLRRFKRMPLEELLDLSVNETMSRTIMTVGTVLASLTALYIFGGEVIQGFTFAMLFGAVVGTYSSVFIAAPFLILVGVKRDWSGIDRGTEKAKSGLSQGNPERSAEPLPSQDQAALQQVKDRPSDGHRTVTGSGSSSQTTALKTPATVKRNPTVGKGRAKARSKKRG